MQTIGQAWLVLRLTGSGTALGLVTALQFLPVLLFGPLGGVLADRVRKRRLLVVTQSLAAIQAFVLGMLTVTGSVRLWMVYALAGALGFVNCADNPTRQTFVLEMVGADDLVNAVTLNSVVINAARVVGPAVAGILIVTIGIGPCFLVNACSFVGVVGALLLMRQSDLHTVPPQARKKGQMRDGLRYVWHTPELRAPLLMMAIVGTLAYEFQVSLPLMARFALGGDASTYSAMSSFMGAGAVVGGLVTASRTGERRPDMLARAALAFGVLILLASVAPVLPVELIVLVGVGATSIVFLAVGNTTLQLTAAPEMRGRVMSLWAVAFLGSTPVGGPIVGFVGQHAGARASLALGGIAGLAAGALGYRTLHRARPAPAPAPSAETLVPESSIEEAPVEAEDAEPEGEPVARP